MYELELKQMAEMSQKAGKNPDITQGGGGNTSVKLDDELMAVKASGCKLKEMTESEGFVVIKYDKIREYYNNVDLESDTDYYADSAQYVKENMVELPGLQKGMRASVEAGFHSLLYKYVIHTHSVYANILTCTKEGKGIAKELFGDSEYGFMWVPYIAPGFELTLGIKNDLEKFDTMPKIIFMESHGIIVTSDDYEECVKLNDYVTEMIKEKLDIDDYKYVGIKETGEDTYVSESELLKGYFKNCDKDEKWFETNILYPDQAAYLSGNISNGAKENKININLESGEIVYKTNYKEALTMEESIVAFIFIVEQAKKNNLTVMTLSDDDINFIKNWEGVKYRKSLLKK